MRQVVITEQGLHLSAEGNSLLISRSGIEVGRIRLGEVESLTLCGAIELSSGAIAVLSKMGLPVVFLTERGGFRARLWTRHGSDTQLRMAQLAACTDVNRSLGIARNIVATKVGHQRLILLRAQRKLKDEGLSSDLARLRGILPKVHAAASVPELIGHEGEAARIYFSHLNKLIRREGLSFTGRSRRPPLDPPNACLSFGYTILGGVVETEVLRRGLDPFPGVIHAPKANRPSLALDILEEFRPFVDALMIRLFNLGQLGPGDFENPVVMDPEEVFLEDEEEPDAPHSVPISKAVHLNATGRKIFLTGFHTRLRDRFHYPPIGGSLALRDIIAAQVNHLARCFRDASVPYVGFLPD